MIIEKALEFATERHKGQKYNKKPFISHPIMVYRIIKLLYPLDYDLQAAALLHDILEDTPTNPAELALEFGNEVASLVYEVTKTTYNTFPNLKTRRAVVLKFADRLSNLSCMEGWSDDKQYEYMSKSKFWKP